VGDCLCGARGSGDSYSVVLADRIRLQKSTSGGRPIAPAGEEPADHVEGSSCPMREHPGSEKTPEAGSRWQSRGIGGGLSYQTRTGYRESGFRSRRALVDERRSGPWKPFSLTRGRGKRFWFSEKRPGFSRALAERDRERQRRPSPTLFMVEKTWAVGASPGAMLGALQK
jgi:hypothetical protein